MFPPREASLIAQLVARDAEFHDPRITPETASALVGFGRASGLLDGPVPYDGVVAHGFRDLWTTDLAG